MTDPRLEAYKQEAESNTSLDILWYDNNFGTIGETEVGGEVSIMLDPPEGVDHISYLGPGWLEDQQEICPAVQRSPEEQTYITYTETAAIVDPSIPFEAWDAELSYMASLGEQIRFWIADLIIAGEAIFGEKYTQAQAITGKSYWTLTSYVRVANAIPPNRRRAELNWTTHRLVASLDPPQQEEILDLAVSEDLNADEVKEKIREIKEPNQPPETRPPCPICGGETTASRCTSCNAGFSAVAWHFADTTPLERALRQPEIRALIETANYVIYLEEVVPPCTDITAKLEARQALKDAVEALEGR